MHRSGTSALTRVLNLLGVDLGEHLMPAAAGNNDMGFWEHAEIVGLHDQVLAALDRRWSDPRPLPANWSSRPEMEPFRA
jgi:O-antigen biosynthesis protein